MMVNGVPEAYIAKLASSSFWVAGDTRSQNPAIVDDDALPVLVLSTCTVVWLSAQDSITLACDCDDVPSDDPCLDKLG